MTGTDFNIDFERKKRLGFPEVVFGQAKTVDQLQRILQSYQDNGAPVLATKVQEEKATALLEQFPKAEYDPISGCLGINAPGDDSEEAQVAIISGGTSDAYVVNEIYYTLKHVGISSTRIQDVGVSGLHRLMNRMEDIKRFKVLIAVAGFEAALPTVLGGLVPQPIIAVPTSVGYGVATGGQAALNSLLASCANGITVVNIDNGYGAAIAAHRILKGVTVNE